MLLESLVEQDYGIELNGPRWARSSEHDSLVIDRERQLFYWNSRNLNGDAYIYLTKVRGLSHQDAKEFLRRSGFSGSFIQEIKAGEETIVYPKLVDVFHESLLKADKTYFYNRTITDETISRFRLGYDNGFYTIPIYQDGLLKQFQMRRDSPKLIKNYYKNVGPLLFNSDMLRVTNRIFITEGLMGCLVLAQNGFPAVSMNIGSEGFQPEWMGRFVHQKQIYILYDNDKAGNYGAIHTAKILGTTRCKVYNFWEFDGQGYAVDDFFIDGGTKEQLMDLILTKSKYSFEVDDAKRTKRYR